MDDLLFIVYGNHPKSKKLYAEAEKVINALRENGELEREKVAQLLNLDLTNKKDKKHFYTIISPMFNKILVSEHRGKTVIYRLSYDMFRIYLDNLRRKAKYYLLNEKEENKGEGQNE
jgi:hypothetical protein